MQLSFFGGLLAAAMLAHSALAIELDTSPYESYAQLDTAASLDALAYTDLDAQPTRKKKIVKSAPKKKRSSTSKAKAAGKGAARAEIQRNKKKSAAKNNQAKREATRQKNKKQKAEKKAKTKKRIIQKHKTKQVSSREKAIRVHKQEAGQRCLEEKLALEAKAKENQVCADKI